MQFKITIQNYVNCEIRPTHNQSLWHFWIISLYGHLKVVYLILKVLAWEICNMKWWFAKKVIIKSQRQFMYGSNFYGSDVNVASMHMNMCSNQKMRTYVMRRASEIFGKKIRFISYLCRRLALWKEFMGRVQKSFQKQNRQLICRQISYFSCKNISWTNFCFFLAKQTPPWLIHIRIFLKHSSSELDF